MNIPTSLMQPSTSGFRRPIEREPTPDSTDDDSDCVIIEPKVSKTIEPSKKLSSNINDFVYHPLKTLFRNEIVKQQSICKFNVYGIIQSFDNETNQLELFDETFSFFKILLKFWRTAPCNENVLMGFNFSNPFSRLSIRIGDIICIKQALFKFDEIPMCINAEDVMTFSSFSSKVFKNLNTNLKYDIKDRQRVESLIKWNYKILNTSKPKISKYKLDVKTLNGVFQVLAVDNRGDETIIVAWNGSSVISEEYPCYPKLTCDDLLQEFQSNDSVYTPSRITLLWEKNELIYITVKYPFLKQASSFKQLSMIVVYDILIIKDHFNYGYYLYSMDDKFERYSRSIGTIHLESIPAITLKKNIKAYFRELDRNIYNKNFNTPIEYIEISD